VREIRATIDRKTIRAPFSGMLGIRQVNLGQYLQSGDPVVPLQSLDPIHVDLLGAAAGARAARRAGGEVQVSAGGRRAAQRPDHRDRLGGRPGDAQRRVQATLANPTARCAPACSSRRGSSSAPAAGA
jgi:membrane fusion protein, multidrug efflux system